MKLILAISALAALVVAQDLNSLPDCGKTCVNNMLGKSAELGCTQGDAKCYCSNSNFSNGLSDCSAQACGASVQQQVLAFGRAYCASVTGGATTTTVAATTTTATSSGASDSASSISSSASSALESAKSSASNAVSSVASSLSSAVSSATSRASSAAGGATSSSSGSFAMKTQAPLAAVGVLGLAALLV